MSPITNLTEFIKQEFEPGLSSYENLILYYIIYIIEYIIILYYNSIVVRVRSERRNPTNLGLVEYRNEALR